MPNDGARFPLWARNGVASLTMQWAPAACHTLNVVGLVVMFCSLAALEVLVDTQNVGLIWFALWLHIAVIVASVWMVHVQTEGDKFRVAIRTFMGVSLALLVLSSDRLVLAQQMKGGTRSRVDATLAGALMALLGTFPLLLLHTLGTDELQLGDPNQAHFADINMEAGRQGYPAAPTGGGVYSHSRTVSLRHTQSIPAHAPPTYAKYDNACASDVPRSPESFTSTTLSDQAPPTGSLASMDPTLSSSNTPRFYSQPPQQPHTAGQPDGHAHAHTHSPLHSQASAASAPSPAHATTPASQTHAPAPVPHSSAPATHSNAPVTHSSVPATHSSAPGAPAEGSTHLAGGSVLSAAGSVLSAGGSVPAATAAAAAAAQGHHAQGEASRDLAAAALGYKRPREANTGSQSGSVHRTASAPRAEGVAAAVPYMHAESPVPTHAPHPAGPVQRKATVMQPQAFVLPPVAARVVSIRTMGSTSGSTSPVSGAALGVRAYTAPASAVQPGRADWLNQGDSEDESEDLEDE